MLIALGAHYPRTDLDRLAQLVAAVTAPHVLDSAGKAVCLATCNRAELYLDAADDAVAQRVRSAWAEAAGWTAAELDEAVVQHEGAAAAEHLLKVTAGLCSIVLGEAEISGQVAIALREAHDRGATTPLLESLFQAACRCGRRVAAETELGAAGRSIGSVALDLVGGVPDSAVIVGTGAFARVITAELRTRGCGRLAVVSPTGRADEFARSHGAEAIDIDQLMGALSETGLAVLCSGHGKPVLTVPLLRDVTDRRAGRRLVVVDLSLERDAEPGIGELPGIDYVDLGDVARSGPSVAQDTRQAAERIVAEEFDRLAIRWRERQVDPAIVALRSHIEQITRDVVGRLPGGALSPEQADLLAHRLSQSLAHEPTLRARELSATGRAAEYLAALDLVYGADVTGGLAAGSAAQHA